MKLSLILTLLFSTSVFALSCPESKKLEEIAMDMIRAEMSGLRLPENEGSDCLKQLNYPHLLIEGDYSNDEILKVDGIVKHLKDIKIDKVITTDAESHVYKVIYEVKIKDKKTGIMSTKKDRLRFFRYTDRENHKIYGCGGITEHPTNTFIFSSCLTK